MKYCPSCQNRYTDDSLRFCLQDGTGLLEYADSSLMPTQDFSERETVVRQIPNTFDLSQSRVTQGARIAPEAKKSNTIPAIIGTAFIMCVFFGGVFVIWRMLNNSVSDKVDITIKTPTPTITPTINNTPNVNERWQPIDYNASLNGERLTYYRGSTMPTILTVFMRSPSQHAAAVDDAQQHHDHRDHQPDVDETTQGVGRDHAQQPQDDEDDGKGSEHGDS